MTDIRVIHGEAVRSMIRLRREGVRVDAVVTDPPYELGFMGKSWDRAGVSYRPRTWRAAYCLLKPGGYLLAFGGTRTHHRIMCAIEDAGFEIRDTMAWMYGSGFPKSANALAGMRSLSRSTTREQWRAFHHLARIMSGSALKPAWEPVIWARKPLAGTMAQNIMAYGTGALNIDAGRLAHNEECRLLQPQTERERFFGQGDRRRPMLELKPEGRWPANVALGCACEGDEHEPDCAVRLLDEQSGTRTSGMMRAGTRRAAQDRPGSVAYGTFGGDATKADTYADSGGASRFFYCAKASRAEREAGLRGLERRPGGSNAKGYTKDVARGLDRNRPVLNDHPTVKPVDLMRWLVRMVTPPGGVVLDMFAGSGTTGVACTHEGFGCIMIERETRSARIARMRVVNTQPSLFAS